MIHTICRKKTGDLSIVKESGDCMNYQEKSQSQNISNFDRNFFSGTEAFTVIGNGEIGGKAQGLFKIHQCLNTHYNGTAFPRIDVTIPRLTVLSTSVFDQFLKKNNLFDIAYSDLPDSSIAQHFQQASLPVNLVGDLRSLISAVHTPLAVRSSSMLEDAMYEPFAGIYGTKMIPNNQPAVDDRFKQLVNAIKYVYASTFFQTAKDYFRATNKRIEDEKMAVIIQEVLGRRHGDRFYPDISGVARSYNFYPRGKAKPEDGVVDLALGLGKTIVDGGVVWSFSPSSPKSKPPVSSARDMLKQTQTTFWAVNMGQPPAYDPMHDTEYLLEGNLKEAEYDNTLTYIASTYDPNSERINIGLDGYGPRIIDFAPILEMELVPLNRFLSSILPLCEKTCQAEVEIEFAVNLEADPRLRMRFGMLQVRPMVVSHETVEISQKELESQEALIASDQVLGNGICDTIQDVVYVKPSAFDAKNTPDIAREIEQLNHHLVKSQTPYILIGFGRWGSSDPWLGIPINWGQISGARVMVEATLENMRVELSQGSHFFHNLTSFQVSYFSVLHHGPYQIDWKWLDQLVPEFESEFVRHVKAPSPFKIKVDGRTGRGVILR